MRAPRAWTEALPRGLLGNLQQLDVEVEGLAGHLVVHVKGDVTVLNGRHDGGEGLAHGGGEHHAVANGELLGTGHLSHGNGLDEALVALAVGLGGLQAHVHHLADPSRSP